MRQTILLAPLLVFGLAAPLAAQEDAAEGFSLLGEGSRMILRDLMGHLEPGLDALEQQFDKIGPGLESLGAEIGPAFQSLSEMIGDWSNYEAPEKLPNGDIIIRRKPEEVPQTPAPSYDL